MVENQRNLYRFVYIDNAIFNLLKWKWLYFETSLIQRLLFGDSSIISILPIEVSLKTFDSGPLDPSLILCDISRSLSRLFSIANTCSPIGLFSIAKRRFCFPLFSRFSLWIFSIWRSRWSDRLHEYVHLFMVFHEAKIEPRDSRTAMDPWT